MNIETCFAKSTSIGLTNIMTIKNVKKLNIREKKKLLYNLRQKWFQLRNLKNILNESVYHNNKKRNNELYL